MSLAQRETQQAQVCRILESRLTPQSSSAIASYAALPEELSIDAWHAQRWAAGFPLWLPRVVSSGILSWHPVTDPHQLATGAYGIREPRPEVVPAQPLPSSALLLVPGVAFTADGWRLGQGGGFYDRLLAHHQGPTIGLAFACQRLADLPLGPYDCRVGEVIFGD